MLSDVFFVHVRGYKPLHGSSTEFVRDLILSIVSNKLENTANLIESFWDSYYIAKL